jgi:hypothetical protein
MQLPPIAAVLTLLFAAIGAVWVVIQIYNHFRGRDRLRCELRYGNFFVPPEVIASLPEHLRSIASVWTFHIHNSGNTTLQDVMLYAPDVVTYVQVISGTGEPTYVAFDEPRIRARIPLDEIPPDETRTLRVWSQAPASEETIYEFTMSHRTGRIRIEPYFHRTLYSYTTRLQTRVMLFATSSS